MESDKCGKCLATCPEVSAEALEAYHLCNGRRGDDVGGYSKPGCRA